MAESNKTKKKKKTEQDIKSDQPPVIFMDERANRPVSLIVLGVLAVIMGFLSKTPLMARTILSTPADLMLIFGVLGIIAGLVLNFRKKPPSDSKKTK